MNLRNAIGEATSEEEGGEREGGPFIDGIGLGWLLGRRDGRLDGCPAGCSLGEADGPIEGW